MTACCAPFLQGDTSFYLNIQILNKEKIVASQVSGKIGGTQKGMRHISKAIGKVANDMIGTEEVTRTVGEQVQEVVPMELARKGITASARLRFTRKTLIVVTIRVLGVDFAEVAAHGEISKSLVPTLQRLQASPLEGFVLSQFTKVLRGKMPEMVASDLRMRGNVIANVKVVPREQQADFMFALLDEIADLEADADLSQVGQKPGEMMAGQTSTGSMVGPTSSMTTPLPEGVQRSDSGRGGSSGGSILSASEPPQEEKRPSARDPIKAAVTEFTGQEKYNFGDITKTVFTKIKDKHEKLQNSGPMRRNS